MFDNQRFKKVRKELNLTQKEFADALGIKQGSLSDIERGKTNDLSNSVKTIVKEKFNVKIDYLYNLSDDIFNKVLNEPDPIYNTNGNKYIELGDDTYDVEVPLIPFAAYASFLESLEVGTVSEDFETMTFNVDRVGRGNYKAFVVKGDSMNNGKINDTPDGAKVLGRELGRHHWKDGFRPTDYGWIIMCNKNIFHKDILKLNYETGEITCHSRNKSPEYSDFNLSLNDCYHIYKVIKRIF
ncbi:helix-turn-helix domain-containing protein [uncultured Wocania sp.]|uniref:helix-turn-helix domain-containing protein n=1 Tax=uncultured Wocania sp. TaxID=2834404 RepID=UPI0030F6E963